MNLFEKIFGKEEKPTEDYWRRNSGKKIMATILEPTEKEVKEKKDENNPNTK